MTTTAARANRVIPQAEAVIPGAETVIPRLDRGIHLPTPTTALDCRVEPDNDGGAQPHPL